MLHKRKINIYILSDFIQEIYFETFYCKRNYYLVNFLDLSRSLFIMFLDLLLSGATSSGVVRVRCGVRGERPGVFTFQKQILV